MPLDKLSNGVVVYSYENLKQACDVLGLDVSDWKTGLNQAYRTKALVVHPDRNGGNDDLFKELNECNEFLKLILANNIDISPPKPYVPPQRKDYKTIRDFLMDYQQTYSHDDSHNGIHNLDCLNIIITGLEQHGCLDEAYSIQNKRAIAALHNLLKKEYYDKKYPDNKTILSLTRELANTIKPTGAEVKQSLTIITMLNEIMKIYQPGAWEVQYSSNGEPLYEFGRFNSNGNPGITNDNYAITFDNESRLVVLDKKNNYSQVSVDIANQFIIRVELYVQQQAQKNNDSNYSP
jgi:hypothetical protein